jgi:hypothetical protein
MLRRKLLSEEQITLYGPWGHGGPGLPPHLFDKMTELLNSVGGPPRIDMDVELTERLAPHQGSARADTHNVLPSQLFHKPRRTAYMPGRSYLIDPAATKHRTAMGAPQPKQRVQGVNRGHLAVTLQFEAHKALGADQALTLAQTLSSWSSFAETVMGCAERAESELGTLVGSMSTQRRELMSLGGRVVWLVLTVAAPPPFGVMVGALVRGLLSEDTWTGCVRTTGEWLMQMTFPQDAQGRIDLGAKVTPGQRARFAPSANTGGHSNTKDLKDMVQVLPGVEKCFTGSQKEWFDKLNKATLQSLCDMAPPQKAAGLRRGELGRLCDRHSVAIRRAIRELVIQFSSNGHNAGRLIDLSWYMQKEAIEEQLERFNYQRTKFIEDTVLDGAKLFLATMTHHAVGSAVGRMGSVGVPEFDEKVLQAKFTTLFVAHYLKQNITKGSAARAKLGDENFYAAAVGTVKAGVWYGPLAEKLKALRITEQRADAPSSFLAAWQPPGPSGGWQPVPYVSVDENARGRLAAWAIEYAARPPSTFERELLALIAPRYPSYPELSW